MFQVHISPISCLFVTLRPLGNRATEIKCPLAGESNFTEQQREEFSSQSNCPPSEKNQNNKPTPTLNKKIAGTGYDFLRGLLTRESHLIVCLQSFSFLKKKKKRKSKSLKDLTLSTLTRFSCFRLKKKRKKEVQLSLGKRILGNGHMWYL